MWGLGIRLHYIYAEARWGTPRQPHSRNPLHQTLRLARKLLQLNTPVQSQKKGRLHKFLPVSVTTNIGRISPTDYERSKAEAGGIAASHVDNSAAEMHDDLFD
jgi:hypothetical protein